MISERNRPKSTELGRVKMANCKKGANAQRVSDTNCILSKIHFEYQRCTFQGTKWTNIFRNQPNKRSFNTLPWHIGIAGRWLRADKFFCFWVKTGLSILVFDSLCSADVLQCAQYVQALPLLPPSLPHCHALRLQLVGMWNDAYMDHGGQRWNFQARSLSL